jgi:micrococcal nuclease
VAVVVGTSVAVPNRRSESLLVRAVINGDTIDVATVGRVRLLGIRAPAFDRRFDRDGALGREARDRLAALVLNHWVRLEREARDGVLTSWRTAYVMREDGVFVNAVMVREGLARVAARYPLTRLQDLKDAEREAQSLRHGIWGLTPSLRSTVPETVPCVVTRKMPARYTAAVKKSDSRSSAALCRTQTRPAHSSS